jgi:hypothetical protein
MKFGKIRNLSSIECQPFPIDLLPSWIRDFSNAISKATETPVDMAATGALGALSAAAAKSMCVVVEPGYVEPLNTWWLALSETGTLKTPILGAVTAPIREYEAKLCKKMEGVIRARASSRKSEEARIAALRQKGARASDQAISDQLMGEANRLEQVLTEVPSPPVLIVADVTPEAIPGLLDKNQGKLAIFSDEAGVLGNVEGRYNRGVSNRDALLQSFSGSDIRVHRVERGGTIVRNPALTMVLFAQPEIFLKAMQSPGFREQGFVGRMVICRPRQNLGWRTGVTEPVPERISGLYRAALLRVLDIKPQEDPDGGVRPYNLHVSSEARAIWREHRAAVEIGMRPGERFYRLKDWASKMPGMVIRLAGLLHLAKASDGITPYPAWELQIDEETMRNAITIMDYFSGHARAVYEAATPDPSVDAARKVVAWIREGKREKFTLRQVHQRFKGAREFRNKGDLEPILAGLVARNFLMEAPQEAGKPGRKSHLFLVNPELFSREEVGF